MTFFAWPGAMRGRLGAGQIASVGFTVPPDALPFWQHWLTDHGIACSGPLRRFEESALSFEDPDGLTVEIVAHPDGAERSGWSHSDIPPVNAIRGLHGVTLWESRPAATLSFLQGALEFAEIAQEEQRIRCSPASGPGTLVDLLPTPVSGRGVVAVGTTHHVAWRVASDDAQLAWCRHLQEEEAHVTTVLDRQYFHSIYFHEPGGVLFEIATDPPGFTLDEPQQSLGTTLRLPPWLEEQRRVVEAALPAIRFPSPVPE
jgi:glyoxalase family protein